MNRKSFLILAVVAVVASLLAVFGLQRENSASIAGASAGRKLLPDFAEAAESLNEITVTGAGNERLVTLGRSEEQWSIAELDNYPADAGAVASLLLALADARIVEEKTSNPDFYPRLGVEDTSADDAASLGLRLNGNDVTHELILGFDHGENQRYARLADSSQSVLVDRNPELPRDPAEWADRAILSIATDRIEQVTIRHADGEELRLLRESPETRNFSLADLPEGRELQHAGVANVTAEALASLQLDAVAAAGPAETEPEVSLEYRTFDGLIVEVTVTESDDGESWLRFSASSSTREPGGEADAIQARVAGWRYQIAAYKLSQMTRRSEDLLQEQAAADE